MNIIHFDVDPELGRYLSGDKTESSLQNFADASFKKADAVSIKTASKADKETLSLFPHLKLLITRTVGTDHIDIKYCREKGIAIYHILDYGSFNIAEHVFALLLTGTRNILSTQDEIKAGKFNYSGHMGMALQGKVIGVVGTGRIGLEVIKRANAFEMEVLAYDVYKNDKAREELGYEYVELDVLLAKSDIITLHAPLLDSTRHMINDVSIQRMKDQSVLINTARGELIDTKALIENIQKFRLVGLDVLEGEQAFDKTNPLIGCANVIITPHIAFYSDASVKKIAEETMRLLDNFSKGSLDGRVDVV